jgi:hypothetical protein
MSSSNIFNVTKPEDTYTIDQFIECQSDEEVNYYNFSYVDQYDNMKYSTYNVISDYLDDIREDYAKTVTLDQNQLLKYMYRPKLLCYDIYGNSELAFIILLLNDMCNVKDFNKSKILMLTKSDMSDITKWIYNSNKDAIAVYNEKNNSDVS